MPKGTLRGRFSDFFALLAFFAVMLFSLSCAKIADPQPPNVTPPSTIQDLRLEQQGDRIVLDFSLPSTYIDGQPLEPRSVAIYRLTLPRADQPPSVGPEQLAQGGQVIEKLQLEGLRAIIYNGRYRFEDVVTVPDRSVIFQRSFLYALRFYSPRNVASQFSNMVFISPVAPAAAPDLHLSRVSERSILLEWSASGRNVDGSAPARVVGYRIFRGYSEQNLVKLADIEGDVRRYSDSAIALELIYYYAVQARSSAEPLSFGPISRTVSVTTTDVFSPLPPQGLAATVSSGRVELVWEPNEESDLQGYNVYRSGTIEGEFPKINDAVMVVNAFSDSPAGKGTFYYRITAVDRKGNESPPCAPVAVELE